MNTGFVLHMLIIAVIFHFGFKLIGYLTPMGHGLLYIVLVSTFGTLVLAVL